MDEEQLQKYLIPYFEVPEDWNITPWQTAILAVCFNPNTRAWYLGKTLRELRESGENTEKILEHLRKNPFPDLENLPAEIRDENKKSLALEIKAMENTLKNPETTYEIEFSKLNPELPPYLPQVAMIKEEGSNVYRPVLFKEIFKNLCDQGKAIPCMSPEIRKKLIQKYKNLIKMYKNGK